MPLRVLVTGSRSWVCPHIARRILDGLVRKHGRDLVVVHGACRGVDASFAMACRELGIPDEPYPADWSRGPRSGPERNRWMVDAGADFAIAVHRNLAGSRGTRDCVIRCLRAGIVVYHVDGMERARRLTELP